MPTFYDSKGNAYVLAGEIGRGGEGTVYFCEGNDELVAKIYHEPVTDEKAEKLRLMAKNQNERLLKVAAWVVEVLHENSKDGRVVGFLMPKIKAKEIHELYSLKSRRQHFPHATWHFLVHTSANLARAFYSLHQDSHVVGDVNHGNCVVLADGTVKLIDCDSFAISNENGKRFRCEVGVATHLPPELQKANLRDAERLPDHDRFGLAVTIFQLLFLGRHPFAGNYLDEQDKSLEDCIREYRFAYGKNAQSKLVKQPPGTLHLSEVSPRIARLFELSFDEKTKRPTPREWVEALVDLSNNLVQCSINPGHRFYTELASCPWCRIESQTGLMLFPFVFSEENDGDEKTFNIFTVEKLLENIGKQRNLPAKIEKPLVIAKPEPLPEIVENAKIQRNNQILYVGGFFIAMILLNLLFGIVAGTFLGFCLMLGLFLMISQESKNLQTNLLEELKVAEDEWEKLEKEWNLLSSPQIFAGDVSAIKNRIADYKNFQTETRKNLKTLEKDQNHYEFAKYLRSFRIAECEIEGVPLAARQKLVEKNVWTAAEIEEKRLLHYYKVNTWQTKKLLQWRESLEKNYKPEKDSEKLEAKKKEFFEANQKEREKIENDIEQSLELLRKNSVQVEQNQKQLLPKSETIAKKISQFKSNLNAVGDTSIALVSLILITFLVPFFGVAFNTVSPPRQIVERDDVYTSTGSGDFGRAKLSNEDVESSDKTPFSEETLTADEMMNLKVPNENITDEEIEKLDYATRRTYSTNLTRRAIWLLKQSKTYYKEALEKVRLAQKIDKDDNFSFEQFGKTLYDKGLYNESLAFFELNKKTLQSQFADKYIALNNLELKQFRKAEQELYRIVQFEPNAFNYYKLGLAYKGLKEFDAAKMSFEYAIQMASDDEEPENIESHYELGYVLFKLKDKEAFNEQYSKLLNLDEEKAAELLKDTYKLPPAKKEIPVIKGNKDLGEGGGMGVGNGSGEGFTAKPAERF